MLKKIKRKIKNKIKRETKKIIKDYIKAALITWALNLGVGTLIAAILYLFLY